MPSAWRKPPGFRPPGPGEKLRPGDKVYRNNRGKSLLLAVIGRESLNQGAVIGAAHIDSPPPGPEAESSV